MQEDFSTAITDLRCREKGEYEQAESMILHALAAMKSEN